MLVNSLVVAALATIVHVPAALAASSNKNFLNHFQRSKDLKNAHVAQQLHRRGEKYSNSSTRYLTDSTKEFLVESLPDVHYDLGEMYSGLIPIDANDTSRELFFVFQPTVGEPVDEVLIWLNGGPGCSSLEGFFQENGRFLWQWGTYQPTLNPYSWVNLTNMLWVEQPVGTGFSIGEVRATSEEEISEDFVRWFKNFQTTFGIKNYKIYVSGESYAGLYVPYISNAMLEQNDTTYYDLSGALVYDPVIGSGDYVQEEAVTLPFVVANNAMLNFQPDFLANLTEQDERCGYAAFREKYLKFPAAGVQPTLNDDNITEGCDIFGDAETQAITINPCFNIYQVNTQCPILWDVLGFPTIVEQDQTNGNPGVYFNRTDVKTAMHAPQSVNWAECAAEPVFVNRTDSSALSIEHVLPNVIEKTNRVLVANGNIDMIIITNGTLLAIQNMTWNGALGFQEAPSTPIDIQLPDLQYQDLYAANGIAGLDGPQGVMGIQHYERGLLWATTDLAGHMVPQFQARSAYRHAQWLLGRIDTL